MTYRLIILTMLFTLTAFAPSFAKTDCKDPQTQTDMSICAGEAYQKADLELNAVYTKAVDKIKESNPGNLKAFRTAQRAWIKFRDLNCQYAADVYKGGSMAPMVRANCLEELTTQRTQQIPALFAEWE